MLGLITGVPGAKKTVFVVSKLDKIEAENKANLIKNIAFYEHNKKLIADNNLQNELTYYYDDVGSGHTLKQVLTILDDDYFDGLNKEYDGLRPDDYYKIATIYNMIINRIVEAEAIKGFKYLLPVRTIYTNINALKIDFVRSLYDLLDDKERVDWRKAPDGSIIVIDEIQLVEPYKQTKNKDEPIIQDLTIHRHRGFDFYFITQSANLLHVQIKDLIGLHWHITVPWGWVSKVYQYGSYRQNPNAVSIKMSAERKFNFSPPDRLFKLYKSTTINTHQKRIPWKPIIGFTSVILFAFVMFFWAVGDSKDSVLMAGMRGKDVAPALAAKADDKSTLTKNPLQVPSAANDTAAPVAGQPLQVPSAANDAPAAPVAGVFDPLSGGYISDINLVPVSGMANGDKCSVYNVNGALLTHISNADCKTYLSTKGMMPKIKSPASASLAATAVSPAKS